MCFYFILKWNEVVQRRRTKTRLLRPLGLRSSSIRSSTWPAANRNTSVFRNRAVSLLRYLFSWLSEKISSRHKAQSRPAPLVCRLANRMRSPRCCRTTFSSSFLICVMLFSQPSFGLFGQPSRKPNIVLILTDDLDVAIGGLVSIMLSFQVLSCLLSSWRNGILQKRWTFHL